MNALFEEGFLLQPIIALKLSDTFKHMAVSIGYDNLKELLSVHASVLLKKPLFTYQVYRELIEFLRQHDCLYLLKS